MITSKATRTGIFFAFIAIALAISPMVLANAETIQLMYFDFSIEPSQPEIIAENAFTLNSDNDYINGIHEYDVAGFRSDSWTYYFEIWSTDRVEIYILDSTGYSSQYTEYLSIWLPGVRPDSYTAFYICDGYLRVEFAFVNVSPKLILISNDTDVTGNYLWTEGTDEIQYSPYHIHIVAGDRTTSDTVDIFNVNASVSIYILDVDQYDFYLVDPNIPPNSSNNIAYETDTLNTKLNYIAEAGEVYHILIWHEEFHDGVTGTIIYNYSYQRGFFENYWSLLLIIFLLIGMALFIVFRKQTLPPVVWTMGRAKYYLLEIPWKTTKEYFGDTREELSEILGKMRGVSEEEEVDKIVSPHKRLTISLLSLIYPISLHRFIVGKIGTAIVSLLINALAILLFYSGFNQILNEAIGVGIVFLVLGAILAFMYIVDIIAAFIGCFKDKNDKVIINWQ